MVIANPIYDVVFKRLMENKSSAKYFIETLLEETIEELEVKPQEFTKAILTKEQELEEFTRMLTVYRLDYIATVRTSTGDIKKVLIEVQKAHHSVDLMRFRNYLAEQYKKEDEVETEQGKKKMALPIVTIYLLGFRLPFIESPAVKISRQYIDLLTHLVIDRKSDFIENLTHDSYIVQTPRIDSKTNTRLEKLLSIFEQRYFIDVNGTIKEYKYEIDDPAIKNMVEILNLAGATPEERKEIEDEIEAWRVINLNRDDMENLRSTIDTNIKDLETQKKDLETQKKALEEKDKAIEQLERELAEIRKNAKKDI